MVKLKNIVGQGVRRPGSSMTDGPEDPRPAKRLAFSEGPAMEARAPAAPSSSAGYTGPRPYSRGSLGQALALARSSAAQCAEALVIDADAATARASIKSLQATWARIASQAGYSEPFILTPNLVFTVVGVLKAANYRSAANYLEAAKRKHIEGGHPWSDQLRQAARMAIRSAKRDIGPSKQAEPLELEALATYRVKAAHDPEGPLCPGRACLLASWWLLREVEASHAKLGHVSIDWSKKEASLLLPNSKSDPMALGTSRAHSCSCKVSSEHLCPFHAMAAQVAFAVSVEGNATGWLFPCQLGGKHSKRGWCTTFMKVAECLGMVTTWENGVPKFTGHTARASGAHHLAKAGVDLWRVQIFGRWSSAAFLRYVRASPLASLSNLASEAALANSIAAAKNELRALSSASCNSRMEDPKELIPITTEMAVETLPVDPPAQVEDKYVANASAGGRIHEVMVHGKEFYPRDWRTRCGWYFGRGLTTYSMFGKIPSGKKCRVCFRNREPSESASSTSDSSSSS